MSLFKTILNFVFPPRAHCLLCGSALEGGDYICRRCQGKIAGSGRAFCPFCGRYWPQEQVDLRQNAVCEECMDRRPPFVAARSLGPYGGVLRDAIYLYKYQGYRSLTENFGIMLADLFLKEPVFSGISALVPVPLSQEKLKARGFNQAELLALKMSSILGVPLRSFVTKIRNTPSQSKLIREARVDSVKGAFQLNSCPGGEQVLLIDDIFTTGATVSECSHLLLRGGASKVAVITLASGMIEKSLRSGLPREEKAGICRNQL